MAKAKRAIKKVRKPVKRAKAPKAKAAPKTPKVKKMPAKILKYYKGLLIQEREKAGGELSHIAENTLKKSARDFAGDLSGYSFHMADMASDDYERDFSLGRATAEQRLLFSIDEALKRVEEGVYGTCLSCHKAISKQRLKALPYTPLCIECQKKIDVK